MEKCAAHSLEHGVRWLPFVSRHERSKLVTPNAHYESIFDLPAAAATQIHAAALRVAMAMASV